jgi:hypothetical protein
MNLQIIQLEAHDDYISARDKMGWIQTGRILLVWPPRGRILIRKLDLVLLQRHCKALGVLFALVTTDSDVIHHADQLGIPIFESVRQAMEAPWRGKRRKIVRIWRNRPPINLDDIRKQVTNPRKNSSVNPGTRIAAIVISLVALLALVSLFIPNAHLVISPGQKTQEIKMTVLASTAYSGVNIAGEIPARLFTTIVEGKDEMITTGKILIPDKSAIGGVRFTNLTTDEIEIPEGTIVSTLGTDPIRFATTRAGVIGGSIGQSVILPVEALFPGQEGNVPAESILAIEGPLGLRLSVLNPLPARNGSQVAVPAASSKDLTTLYHKLLEVLEATALNELKSQLDQGDVLIENTLTLSNIIEERYDPPEDQPANQLELTLQLEFNALAIQITDINNLANLVLDANLPEGYLAIPDTIDIRSIKDPTIDVDEIIHWQVILRRDIMANINSGQVINFILGLPSNQASLRLVDTYDLMKAPDITLSPTWWPRMPYIPFRIHITNLGQP